MLQIYSSVFRPSKWEFSFIKFGEKIVHTIKYRILVSSCNSQNLQVHHGEKGHYVKTANDRYCMYPSISDVCSNSIFTTNEHPEDQQWTFPAGQTLWTHFTHIQFIMHKPGPPRFALSTILEIFKISIFKPFILKIIMSKKETESWDTGLNNLLLFSSDVCGNSTSSTSKQLEERQFSPPTSCPWDQAHRHPCTSEFREADGVCTNREQKTWGMSVTPFSRVLRPHYEDGKLSHNSSFHLELPDTLSQS